MLQKNKLRDYITQKIQKGGEITPFFCMGYPLDQLNQTIYDLALELCRDFEVDRHSISLLKDTGEALKIEEIRDFIALSSCKSSFRFQVFIIEGLSRMTHQSSNAVLKFFEEPGEGNIILLTAENESGIIETILSRVTPWYFQENTDFLARDTFWYPLVRDYLISGKTELISHVFQNKLEKSDALVFLKTLLILHKEGVFSLADLDSLDEDIRGVMKNNFLPRYIVDKWIFTLK